MRNRFLLGAGVALAAVLSWANAEAQMFAAPSGPGTWYFGGQTGWSSLDNPTGHVGGIHLSENYNAGYGAGVRGGYEWGPWRLEEEFAYAHDGLHSINFGGFSTLANGQLNSYAFMTNLLYDFNVGWAITPHIGAGIGAVDLQNGASIQHPGPFGLTTGKLYNSSVTEFGYQAIAGIRYNINPSLAFDLDYRYLGTAGATFHAAKLGGSYTTGGISSNNLVASLTVRLGATLPVLAPPAPPAPPPMARKVFLVFFDWDKSTITPEGMAIIQQAAAAFRAGGPVTIQVTGYTDSSGSVGYNQRLSERRASAVAQAMVGLGVPQNQMVVSGRGENDQRVPTAKGVREPQNRRVEILFP